MKSIFSFLIAATLASNTQGQSYQFRVPLKNLNVEDSAPLTLTSLNSLTSPVFLQVGSNFDVSFEINNVTQTTKPVGLSLSPNLSFLSNNCPSSLAVQQQCAFTTRTTVFDNNLTPTFVSLNGSPFSINIQGFYPSSGISNQGLLLHLPFNGNIQGSPVALTATGSLSYDSNKPFITPLALNSASFQGNFGLANPNQAVLVGTTDFTIGFWITSTSSANPLLIVQQRSGPIGSNAGINGQFQIRYENGNVCYWDGNFASFNAKLCHSQNIKNGQWHFVAVSRTADQITLSVNAQPETFTYPIRSFISTAGISIGYDQRSVLTGGNPFYLQGNLADLFIFSRALSSAELLQIYQRRAPLF